MKIQIDFINLHNETPDPQENLLVFAGGRVIDNVMYSEDGRFFVDMFGYYSEQVNEVTHWCYLDKIEDKLNESMGRDKKDFIGKSCIIKKPHPHAGKYGVVDRVEMVGVLRKEGLVIDLNDGGECFVFSIREIELQ